jgi:hypothetical protein
MGIGIGKGIGIGIGIGIEGKGYLRLVPDIVLEHIAFRTDHKVRRSHLRTVCLLI